MIAASRSRLKAVLLMSLLVAGGMVAGFFAGIMLSAAVAKKKENPVFWKQAAMTQLKKLHPDAEQQKKFGDRTDRAVQELVGIRKEAIKDIWDVVQRAMTDIEKDLTPEQRKTFEKIKPKPPPEAR